MVPSRSELPRGLFWLLNRNNPAYSQLVLKHCAVSKRTEKVCPRILRTQVIVNGVAVHFSLNSALGQKTEPPLTLNFIVGGEVHSLAIFSHLCNPLSLPV